MTLNVDNRVDIRLLTHCEKIYKEERLVSKSNFKDVAIFGENLGAV